MIWSHLLMRVGDTTIDFQIAICIKNFDKINFDVEMFN